LRIVKILLVALVVVALAPYVIAPFYRTGHPVSTLMAWRSLRGAPMHREWIDLAAMSPSLLRSVVAAEDAHFCKHHGIDWGALREAIDDAREDGTAFRGASTITQQVAKNLFLWQGGGWVRKGIEAWYTLLIELLWPKTRILEVYANIAEFGDGIYGAQAASRSYWRKDANRLSLAESARLAAVLPSPRRYSVARPGPFVQRRANWIQRQVRQIGGPAYLDTLD